MNSLSLERFLAFTGIVALCVLQTTTAFTASFMARNMKQAWRLRMAGENKQQAQQEQAIECFVVNSFQVDREGATPHVVCTSQPDEYAWYNGIERQDMVETDGALPGALECVQGASPRGFTEWECTHTETELSWQ